ncbi:SDR family oxidoreductase [Butyrivibrio sp. AE3004]|uniref:SDR family oxidoreductase n=1 Tax=Butyrivibrio sp. AE3004 TaxID=1506994 RepID=UPI0004947CBE|nr:SDR family oxidoreductase [Butyrivibrio sp. AE3004]
MGEIKGVNAFDVIEGLLKLQSADLGIGEFFKANEVRKVAVYGLGRVGALTYDIIKDTGVEIIFAIDKNYENLSVSDEELIIIPPNEIKAQDRVDLIVVTPMEHYYDIKEELETLTDADIISIGEIVEYCLDGESLPGLSVINKVLNQVENGRIARKNSIDREKRSQKILVFGGGGGIGKAIAKRMLDEGSEVIIVGRTAERLETVKLELDSERLHFFSGDISQIDTHERMFKRAADMMDGLDAFVNASAISLETKARGYEPWDITEEEWDEVSDINFKAAYFLMRNEVSYFLENNIAGNILNFSSNAACMDIQGIYGAAKLAIMRWTRSFGKKFGHHGIIINGIAPGATFTPIISSYAKSLDQQYSRHAIERFIAPEEIAELALLCLSNKGVALCGTTIIADGGDEEAY